MTGDWVAAWERIDGLQAHVEELEHALERIGDQVSIHSNSPLHEIVINVRAIVKETLISPTRDRNVANE